MAQKILVCGDVKGNFRHVFNKVDKQNRKNGPFDVVLCVGDFFGPSPSNWEPYRVGALKVPAPTYILGPNDEEHVPYYGDANGSELCPNVYHLGKRGILTAGGLKIAYVSGVEDSKCEAARISQKDVQAVRDTAYKGKEPSGYLGIDILLTSDWPKNVSNLIGTVEDEVKKAAEEGSSLLSWLASQVKPRYHFAGLKGVYYERQPYRNHQLPGQLNTHCTRFISLSSFGGKKWIYGAVLTPIEKMNKEELYQRTSDETESPYERGIERVRPGEQYFFDMTGRDSDGRNPKKRKLNFDPEKCWFCLAGGQDLQTVISIGTEAYVAIPKGGLHRLHLIVCPVKHLESYLHLPRSVRDEVANIKSALREYYARSRDVPVFFERYYRTSHMQLNAVPVPASKAVKLRSAFDGHAKKHNLDLQELPADAELGDIFRLNTPYLYVELPDGVRLYVRCRQNFPIQFARIVLASKDVLDDKGKVEWKDCVLPEAEEQELTLKLRNDLADVLKGS